MCEREREREKYIFPLNQDGHTELTSNWERLCRKAKKNTRKQQQPRSPISPEGKCHRHYLLVESVFCPVPLVQEGKNHIIGEGKGEIPGAHVATRMFPALGR